VLKFHTGVDTSVAHIARVQDYWLGGYSHFKVDRIAGDVAIAALPEMVESVRNTRAFLGRTVRYLAAEAGIRQFLDIGTGLPTAANTHEMAQTAAPDSKVVYVDNDPMVLAHARALLTSGPRGECAYIDADIRDTKRLLDEAAAILDFGKPVGVVLVAVLQFVPDADDPYAVVRRLMNALPAGSYLVISHPASDLQAAAMARMTIRLNRLLAQQVKPRSREEVTRFFDGLELLEPGVIRCPEWRPAKPEDTVLMLKDTVPKSKDAVPKSTMWGGVAHKRRS
jgi:hypothetical protein